MRLKMIGFAGVSLLLLAGCGPKGPSADGACVQKPVCAVPAQPAPPPAATTPPPRYAPIPRPRRAVRYRSSRWSSGGGSYSRRSESYSYDGGVRDYAQIYGSVGDTRLAGVKVQVQTSDSYSQSTQSESSYSSYGGGSVVSYGGGSVYGVGGCQGPCGQGGVRAAGRDRNGYLTWPSK